jgi:hypothetical protein
MTTKPSKNKPLKLIAAFAAAATLTTFGYIGSAQAVGCNVSFNDYAALTAANETNTFLLAPWYNQKCGNYTIKVAENPAGEVSNHYHLLYENACVNCFVNGEYGLNRTCAGTGTGCQAIDNAAYGRYAGSMTHGQMITTTISPNPGQYCKTQSNGSQRCVSLVGRLFNPSLIVVKSGPVDVWGTKVYLIGNVPVKLDVAIKNLNTGVWDISAFGTIDQITVTGSSGSNLNFGYDNIYLTT